MSIILSPYPKLQFINNNGVPMAGCLLYTYRAGTSTPLATYADGTGTAYNTNPVILDAGGRASIWLDSNVAYKFVLYNSNGSILWTVDNINTTDESFIATIDTIADLQAINTTTMTKGTVTVLGYYTTNDGGGGDFMFVPTDTIAPDNGYSFAPTVGSGRWHRICESEINVLWYGAYANSGNDSAAAFAAANSFASAQQWALYVPAGTFQLDTNPLLTVPVRFAPLGILTWASFTMNIKPIIADFSQHFSCSSSAACNFQNSIIDIYPEWFGAKGDGSFTSNTYGTDDTSAIQTALNSASTGNWIVFNSTKKYWSGPITLKEGVNFKGSQSSENDTSATPASEYKANLQYNSTGGTFLGLTNSSVGGLRGITVKDLIIDGNNSAVKILDLQTRGSVVMGCTLRNATIGISFSGSADSSINKAIFNVFRNLTNGILTSGAGCVNGIAADNIFINSTIDLNFTTQTGWAVHDNIQSSYPVTGPVSHIYGRVNYNNNILGASPVSTTSAPPSAVLLSQNGGWANNSSTYGLNSTSIFNNQHLIRYSSSLAIGGARLHDSLGYDTSGITPRVDTRSWYERSPDGSHHWGDLATEFMTLSNTGVLSFPQLGTSGSIPVKSTNAASYAYVYYAISQNLITLCCDTYYRAGIAGVIYASNYPCYSITNPTTQTFATNANSTVPFALGPLTITAFAAGPVLQVGQYIMLTVGTTWSQYTASGGNRNKMMWGQVTAYNALTPSLTINIMYYRSQGSTNFVTAGMFYIHSAFPFLLKQPSSIHATTIEGCGIGTDTAGGVCETYRYPEIGLIFDVAVPDFISPFTTLLDSQTPSTES